MYTAISVLVFIICLLLILIVLVQNSKGGGLASSFASSNQIMGVRKTTDFLEKATWTLAGAMMILCVLAVFFIPKGENGTQSAIQEQIDAQPMQQQAIPSFPGVTDSPETAPATDNETPAE
ncbi:MAG: preprotein translocase subunit SecG [Odoribacter sp.]|nr:preprotein translocase subunit SecG [Odoribacter sp.]